MNIVILLCLTLLLAQTASAQFDEDGNFIGRTWDAFDKTEGAKAVCDNDDIDDDNDGLIELCYLEDVDAMRYVLGGSGYQASTAASIVTTGCPLVEGNETCKGYELVRDLDFNDDASYSSTANKVVYTVDDDRDSTDSGWQPIGYYTDDGDDDNDEPFNSLFEGNGHSISNLMINRPNADYVGLFGYTGGSSTISNISLLNVKINGRSEIGSLVGRHGSGSITNSYAGGSVNGGNIVGGLVGRNNNGSIANSYATSSVDGSTAGGLVGQNEGNITNSYATGFVQGGQPGGLVSLGISGSITNSYATGSVDGFRPIGGLASVFAGSITNSYWDTEASGISTSSGGIGKTTADLQSPPAATGIYSEWGNANWDFGTDSQYPAVKYAQDCGTSQQPDCGTVLQGQRSNKPRIIYPTTNTEILITQNDRGTDKTIPVRVSDDDVNDELTLFLRAVDKDQNLVVLRTTRAEVLPNGNADRAINEDLIIRVPRTIIFGMTTLRLVAEDNSVLGNTISDPVLFKLSVIANRPPTITPIPSSITLPQGTSTTLNVLIEDTHSDPLSVRLDSSDSTVATATIVAINNANYTFKITALSAGTAVITVTADDGIGGSTEVMFTIPVDAEPTGTVSINPTSTNKWILESDTSSVMDANGIAETNYQWFRNNAPISDATTNTYTIPNDNDGRAAGTRYKVDVTFVDNIEQEVTTSSNVYKILNEAPVIDAISQKSVNEGGTVFINPTVRDANHDDLDYEWSVIRGAADLNEFDEVSEGATLSFKVPADWIEDTSASSDVTKTLQLEVLVDDGSESTTRAAEVVVAKVNNGVSATIRLRIDRDESNERELMLKTGIDDQAIAADPDGENSSSDKSYQWQWCQSPCSSWMDISGATTSTYTILPSIMNTNVGTKDRFRIGLSYTDGQGYSETIYSNSKATSASAEFKVRAKVFLEGALQ